MNRLFKDRRILYYMLSIMIILVFTLTIAYAALNTVLKITGNAEVVASSWDIYLDNVQLMSGSATTNVPTITDKTTASFSATLTNPGDYYMFTIDVVNNGSIDAMIDSIEKLPELSSDQAKYLNYTVEYQNGESISTKQLVEANSFVRLKVKVEFRKDLVTSDLPSTSETLDLLFKVNYIQADEDGTSSITNSGKLVKVVSGNYDTIGSEVCIDTECFYVISSTENDVTMLSKHNLYIGGNYIYNTWVPYGSEATGMQDATMLGWVTTGQPYKGATPFSDSLRKGENYSDYSGSIVEQYVNDYKNSVEKFGVKINEARLITKEELTNQNTFACNEKYASCSTLYPWIYSSSYWTSSAFSSTDIWLVGIDNYFGYRIYAYSSDGVRPVITISKSEF